MVSVPCFCPFFLLGFRQMVFLLRFSSGLCAGEAHKGLLASPPEPGFFLLAGLDVMLYDPLAVKRLASAVCVLPPTPRSLIGPSGSQGCESSSTTESSREPGLDAGARGRLYCVPSQEEEQQRPVVGHGIVLGECPSQENLAKGKGLALGAERSST